MVQGMNEPFPTPPAPWGGMDPNSSHQVWSRWTFVFRVRQDMSEVGVKEVTDNARRFFAAGFGSTAGRVRCDAQQIATPTPAQQGTWHVVVTLEIEGPPVHDPDLRTSVKADFREHFVKEGFGPSARFIDFSAGLLAGDVQDGKPPAQLLVMPAAVNSTILYGQRGSQ